MTVGVGVPAVLVPFASYFFVGLIQLVYFVACFRFVRHTTVQLYVISGRKRGVSLVRPPLLSRVLVSCNSYIAVCLVIGFSRELEKERKGKERAYSIHTALAANAMHRLETGCTPYSLVQR